MEEKKIVYAIVLSIWNLSKEYLFRNLNDEEWEELIEKGNELAESFMKHGTEYKDLFLKLFYAITDWKGQRQHEISKDR